LKEGLQVTVASDAFQGRLFEGTITAINPEIDAATRNVRIQATMANPGGKLRPGMFVTVDTFLDKSQRMLLIPAAAVLHAPFGDSVFIVEEGKDTGAEGEKQLVVRQQFVRLGQRLGDFVAATQGVKIGEKIVATGSFKLRPGMAVVIDNTLAPSFKLAPTPDNT
jgi:membrane fusion protein (multidrug efflux system)